MVKQIFKRILNLNLLLAAILLSSCIRGPRLSIWATSPSALSCLSKGMTVEEVIETVTNEYWANGFGEKLDSINVEDKRYKMITVSYRIAEIHRDKGKNKNGSSRGYDITLIKDQYYLLFTEDNKLFNMGYVYEFIRSSNLELNKIGKALRERTILKELNES